MRERKYRAWDKEKKVMSYSNEMGLNWFFDVVCDGLSGIYDNFIVMDYIGGRDKNGKEIYFQDLIKYDTGIFKVLWNSIRGKIFLHRLDTKGISFIDADMLQLGELLGNVYENPELLENKK